MKNKSSISQLLEWMRHIPQWFAPPIFANDEIEMRRSFALNYSLIAVMVASLGFILVAWIRAEREMGLYVSLIIVFLACLGSYWGMRHGAIKLLSLALIAVGFIGLTAIIVALDGIYTPLTSFYLILLLIAGLLFDTMGMLVMAVIAAIVVAGLMIATETGWLVPHYTGALPLGAIYAALLVQSVLILYWTFKSLRQSLARAEQEIAERTRVETFLRESEERYRILVDLAPMAILVHINGRIELVNQTGAEMFGGTSPADFIGKSMFDFVHPDYIEPARKRMLVALQENKPAPQMEMLYKKLDGQFINVLSSGNQISYQGKRAIMVTIVDITERKRAEKELRASEEKYRGLMESLDSAILVLDYDGRFLYVNHQVATDFSTSVEKLIGTTLFDLLPEAVASERLANVRQVFRENQKKVVEEPTEIGGQLRWYRTSIQPLHDEQGQVVSVLVVSTDIHELKTMHHELNTVYQELQMLNQSLEDKVKERAAQWQDLYGNAPVGYQTLDANDNFTLINQTELNWLGYTREELIGKSFATVLADELVHEFREQFLLFKVTHTPPKKSF